MIDVSAIAFGEWRALDEKNVLGVELGAAREIVRTGNHRVVNDERSEEHTSELQSQFHIVYLHSFPTRRSSDLVQRQRRQSFRSFSLISVRPHISESNDRCKRYSFRRVARSR